ncbi:MAG TPA: UPF0158 family protein [Burkholderiaceae bacterium]|nr:UPF0158 family protein [Burkholderiaceae bacterium]
MSTPGPATTVRFADLRDAFDFVSAGPPSENSAYIDRRSGKIFCVSSTVDIEQEDVPDDLETSDQFIAVPHKYDLDLGRALALDFVARELPADFATAKGYFRSPGAYGRFKDLLERRGKIEAWYAFEERSIEEALREWCRDNDIRVTDDPAAA